MNSAFPCLDASLKQGIIALDARSGSGMTGGARCHPCESEDPRGMNSAFPCLDASLKQGIIALDARQERA